MTKIVLLVALEYLKGGVRTEAAPGVVVDIKDEKVYKPLLESGNAREPTEAELALYDRQNPDKVIAEDVKANDAAAALVKKDQTQPTEPNGAGGASGVVDSTDGSQANGSVASDTDSAAVTDASKKTEEDKAADASKTTTKAKSTKAKRNDDLV